MSSTGRLSSNGLRLLRVLPALCLLGLLVLPLLGMWLWFEAPTGLFEPEPVHMDRIWPLVGRTLALSVVVVTGSLVLGSFLAWTELRVASKWRAVWSALALLPLAVPSYLLAKILREQMAPAGPLGEWIGTEGAFAGFWPAALCLTITCTPYVHLLVGAALARCPQGEEEAARSLGASAWRVWFTVVGPRLRPTWAFSAVLVGLYVVSDFGAVAVLDCEVLTWRLYQAHSAQEAVLLGTSLIGMVLPLLVLVRLLHGGASDERALVGREASLRHPGPGVRISLAVARVIMVGIGVFVPVLTMAYWVSQGVALELEFMDVLEPASTSVWIAAVGAALTLVGALLLSASGARLRGILGGLVDNTIYLTSALPGILVAVGLLQLVLHLRVDSPTVDWSALRDAGLFLFLGFAMRFMAQGYAALKPALLRLDQGQSESARSLGAGSMRRFWTIVLPQIQPSLLAAYVLLFLSIAKELPITLMLIPPGESTLAYAIFDANNEGVEQNIGLAGLTLLAVALCLQIGLNRWRKHV